MKTIKISVIMSIALLLSVGLFAQRGRGYNNSRGYNNNQYRHYNQYNQNRNQFSVTIGPRYNYRPNYRPYYRPVTRYRPIYRPVYRSPRTYVHYGPSFGFRLHVLPFGYSQFNVGPVPYYYNDGVYYRNYNNGGYEVVAPPLNATVNRLPANATVTVIDGQKYYQVGGTFYQEEFSENNKLSYRVVGTDGVINTDYANEDLNAYDEAIPNLGSRYDELPAESKVQVINQQKYFVTPGGVYYKEVIEGDKIRYEVTAVQ
ncbi:MAG: hypothetical protein IPF72_07945 [Chitinophagaceae bacterium]|nr:hypothetical protein [Chitinophagaceae bacterium]